MPELTPEREAEIRAAAACKPDSMEEAWACVRVLKEGVPQLLCALDTARQERDQARLHEIALQSWVDQYHKALQTIARGDYDNAHDCKAAAKVAAKALEGQCDA